MRIVTWAAGVISGLSSSTPAAVGTAAVGVSTAAARGDHVHPVGGSTAGAALGTAAAGTSVEAARADHVHALPAGATVALALGTASAGTSAELSRVDHVHVLPAGATVALALGTASAGVSSELSRVDHVHALPAGATTALNLGTASAGVATELSRVDHVHPTNAIATALIPSADGLDAGSTSSRWDVYSRERYLNGTETAIDYTVAAGDDVIVVTVTGKTVTLPDLATFRGRTITVKGRNVVLFTIARAGADTIDGATTKASVGTYDSFTLWAPETGTDWAIL